MSTMMGNAWAIWMWPLKAAQLGNDLLETASRAHSVISARLPMIEEAMRSPWTADHQELSRMVTEKVSAFGASGRATAHAGDLVRRASAGNVRALGRVASGGLMWPQDWLKLAEANLAACAAMATLPGAALAPIHRGVPANQKRLG